MIIGLARRFHAVPDCPSRQAGAGDDPTSLCRDENRHPTRYRSSPRVPPDQSCSAAGLRRETDGLNPVRPRRLDHRASSVGLSTRTPYGARLRTTLPDTRRARAQLRHFLTSAPDLRLPSDVYAPPARPRRHLEYPPPRATYQTARRRSSESIHARPRGRAAKRTALAHLILRPGRYFERAAPSPQAMLRRSCAGSRRIAGLVVADAGRAET